MDENASSKSRQSGEQCREQPDASRRRFLRTTVGTGLAGLGVGTAAGAESAETLDFRVTERTPESVTLAWNQGEPSRWITHYRLDVRGDIFHWQTTTEEQSITIEQPPLRVDEEQSIDISAVEADGTEHYEQTSLSDVSLADAERPAPPTDLAVAESARESVTLSWTAPDAPVDRYDVYWVPIQDEFNGNYGAEPKDGAEISSTETADTSITLSAVDTATPYYVWVQAVRNGTASKSATTGATTVGIDWSGEGTVFARGGSTVSIEWELTTTDGLELDHYKLSWWRMHTRDGPDIQTRTLDAGATSATINGLDPGERYAVSVAGVDRSGATFPAGGGAVATVVRTDQDIDIERFVTARDIQPRYPSIVADVETTDGETTVRVEDTTSTSTTGYHLVLDSVRFQYGRLGLTIRHAGGGGGNEITDIRSITQLSLPEEPDEVAIRYGEDGELYPWRPVWTDAEGPLKLTGPVVSVTHSDSTSIDLELIADDYFDSSEHDGEYIFRIDDDDERQFTVKDEHEQLTIGGLSPATQYEIKYRSVADDGSRSPWQTATATTDSVQMPRVNHVSFDVDKEPGREPDAFLGVNGSSRRVVEFTHVGHVHPCENLVLKSIEFDEETFRIVVDVVKEQPQRCLTEVAVKAIYRGSVVLDATPARGVLERAGHGVVDTWQAHDESLPSVDGTVPQDVDGDGRYMDMNANDRIDSDDVATYFEHTDDPALTNDTYAYDYNDNDRIDFDDVQQLFENL